jgi:hypothetical protein
MMMIIARPFAAQADACKAKSRAGIANVSHACAANFTGNTTSGSYAIATVFANAVAYTVACTSASTVAFASISVYTSAFCQHHPTSSADVHAFSVCLL